jgi:hypothetical protein
MSPFTPFFWYCLALPIWVLGCGCSSQSGGVEEDIIKVSKEFPYVQYQGQVDFVRRIELPSGDGFGAMGMIGWSETLALLGVGAVHVISGIGHPFQEAVTLDVPQFTFLLAKGRSTDEIVYFYPKDLSFWHVGTLSLNGQAGQSKKINHQFDGFRIVGFLIDPVTGGVVLGLPNKEGTEGRVLKFKENGEVDRVFVPGPHLQGQWNPGSMAQSGTNKDTRFFIGAPTSEGGVVFSLDETFEVVSQFHAPEGIVEFGAALAISEDGRYLLARCESTNSKLGSNGVVLVSDLASGGRGGPLTPNGPEFLVEGMAVQVGERGNDYAFVGSFSNDLNRVDVYSLPSRKWIGAALFSNESEWEFGHQFVSLGSDRFAVSGSKDFNDGAVLIFKISR